MLPSPTTQLSAEILKSLATTPPRSEAPKSDQAPSQVARSLAYSASSSSVASENDRLPLLHPPQLNNVQDLGDTLWVSTLDDRPYVKVFLKTRNQYFRAEFADLSARKQKDLLDKLAYHRHQQSLSEATAQDAKTTEELIRALEKFKRPMTSVERKLQMQSQQTRELQLQRQNQLQQLHQQQKNQYLAQKRAHPEDLETVCFFLSLAKDFSSPTAPIFE
jgi:hypothetical protein